VTKGGTGAAVDCGVVDKSGFSLSKAWPFPLASGPLAARSGEESLSLAECATEVFGDLMKQLMISLW
jgi:hypothetical protein